MTTFFSPTNPSLNFCVSCHPRNSCGIEQEEQEEAKELLAVIEEDDNDNDDDDEKDDECINNGLDYQHLVSLIQSLSKHYPPINQPVEEPQPQYLKTTQFSDWYHIG